MENTRRQTKDLLDNLEVSDEVNFEWKIYIVIDVDWEFFDLQDIKNWETKFVYYNDLFDDIMEDKLNTEANLII